VSPPSLRAWHFSMTGHRREFFVTEGNPISSISVDIKKVLFALAGATC
jgi:hypothetical protein